MNTLWTHKRDGKGRKGIWINIEKSYNHDMTTYNIKIVDGTGIN